MQDLRTVINSHEYSISRLVAGTSLLEPDSAGARLTASEWPGGRGRRGATPQSVVPPQPAQPQPASQPASRNQEAGGRPSVQPHTMPHLRPRSGSGILPDYQCTRRDTRTTDDRSARPTGTPRCSLTRTRANTRQPSEKIVSISDLYYCGPIDGIFIGFYKKKERDLWSY